MTVLDLGAAPSAPSVAAAFDRLRRRVWVTFGLIAAVIAYLVYAWAAFDVTALLSRAEPQRALVLATDSVAHKVHVTRDLRRGGLEIAVEGERTATYVEPPAWVTVDGEDARIDLGQGYVIETDGAAMSFEIPGYGILRARVEGREIVADVPDGVAPPEWLRIAPRRLDARPTWDRRVQITRSKIEVHRYFWGWENFWFPFNSPLFGLGAGELWSLAVSRERIEPDVSNARLIFRSFWTNPDWQHGHVFVALLETILMAVLGTMTAALVALPMAFLAAKNFAPSQVLRFVTRRFFDFLRGVDALIWSLIFIRAFGLGPLTGALAIAVTDTGTLGKLFSEALENVDGKQIEGVRSTGAAQVARYRYGVIPQIMPVFLSQVLYYLESNTRSATVIGALGAGGIGLVLVETIRTSRDWENTLYIVILTLMVVILMDQLSGWLRRRLIQGR